MSELKHFIYFSLLSFYLSCSIPEKNCDLYKNGTFEFTTEINNEIITSIDILNEIKYLKIINQELIVRFHLNHYHDHHPAHLQLQFH